MIIGIGGISRGGKSFLAKEIKKNLNHKQVIILHQDDFVLSKNKIPKIRNHIDWESPLSINFDLFYTSILDAHNRAEIVIAEGLFAFYNKEINAQYSSRILVELPKYEFVKRKRRDGRWGYEEDWYIEHIWQSYLFYGKPDFDKSYPYLHIDGSQNFDTAKIIKEILPKDIF
jgi:uridine kinase